MGPKDLAPSKNIPVEDIFWLMVAHLQQEIAGYGPGKRQLFTYYTVVNISFVNKQTISIRVCIKK